MFETAELGHVLDKATYDQGVPALREELLKAQYEALRAATFPIILVVAGVPGAGKGDTVRAVTEWLDTRHVQVHAMGDATDEEAQRPPMWRFWRRLPPKGKIGIFFDSWYQAPITGRALGKLSETRFSEEIGELRRFEKMLADEGALLLKLWFHLPKKEQQRRVRELWKDEKTRFRVSREDERAVEHAEEFREVGARTLLETDAPEAPWLVLDGFDARYRNFNTGRALLESLQKRLAVSGAPNTSERLVSVAHVEQVPLVRTLDLTRKLELRAYEEQLTKYQRKLALLTLKRGFRKISPVLVFEGVDAAGKGGAIRRVTRALDPRIYDVHAIAAPTEEERAQPYLWRFWRHAPRDGKFAIFDRSWYGRVLVERVEHFASDADWRRAYGEINDFERQLTNAGNVVVKFWLQVSKETQLARFQEREQTSFKRFKITPDDWRNREKWEAYERASSDMIEHTSTESAPWTLVEAEDKLYGRVKVLRSLCEALERAL